MGVLGIGGLFFRARDPEALTAWYRDHLGVGGNCVAEGSGAEPSEWVWMVGGGPLVFQPFKADSDYFAADKAYMLNLRVTGLDGLVEKLQAAGIAVITKPEWNDPTLGRFVRIHDPEGNAIELWEQPPAA